METVNAVEVSSVGVAEDRLSEEVFGSLLKVLLCFVE